jgi:thioredoxin 1
MTRSFIFPYVANHRYLLVLILVLISTVSFPQDNPDENSDSSTIIRSMTVEEFNKRTTRNEKLVLVNFSADWCIVCKRQKPVLDDLSAYYKDSLLILEIDMEHNPLIAEHFQVDALPVHLLYKKGELVWDRVGLQTKTDLMNAIWIHRIKSAKK